MDASDYQQQAARTLIDAPGFELTDQETMAIWNAIGLTGEAGEVADQIKKGIFHRHGLDLDKLEEEIGDLLWYAAALCTTLGLDLTGIMEMNIEKLKQRYPDGYSSERSIHRVEYRSKDGG